MWIARLICGSIMPAVFAAGLLNAAATDPVLLSGRVIDENGVSVQGARLEVFSGEIHLAATSDSAGKFSIELPAAGEYQVRAEQQGFFIFTGKPVSFQAGSNQLTITLNHLREFTESVDVRYSPPVIDPQEPDEHKQLNSVEILEVPYPASQDLRSALPLIQGVVRDVNGDLHFNGGATDQTNYTLDGFNIADPFTGKLDAR